VAGLEALATTGVAAAACRSSSTADGLSERESERDRKEGRSRRRRRSRRSRRIM
jgi:hypothetical protein